MFFKLTLSVVALAVLSACGGGSSEGSSITVPPSVSPSDPVPVPVPVPTPPAPVPVPLPVPVPNPVPDNDIADINTYRLRASQMGTDEGIEYRYGPDALSYGTAVAGNTYSGPRASKSYQTLSVQRGEVQKDGIVGNRGCGANGWCGEYQIGENLFGEPGDYSSSIVNVGYIPDVPPIGFLESKYWGVASLQQISVAHNTVAWSPEVSWTTYAGANADNGSNDENTVRLAGVRSGSPIGTAPIDAKPVASARGYGRGGWVNNVLTVFSNGWITSAGSNTSHNFLKVKIPDGKTPTGIAITNSGEFALVTVWDATLVKGQVVVIALSDGCQWCETKPESEWDANWGSARQAYPGMPGLGNYLKAKVIGLIDLPETMKAPTEISVTTGHRNDDYQVIRNFFNSHMQNETNRKKYYDGEWTQAIARTGMAVVISKSEKRAAFIDLKPLFQYYRNEYFTKNDTAWNAMIANRGDAPNQFPNTFDVAPSQKPTVIKVIDLPEKPTAVKLGLEPPFRAYIATQEGKLRVYDLGTKYLDQTGVSTGTPNEIVEKFSIDVGKNPTSIAYVKEKALLGGTSRLFTNSRPEQHLWVLSR